MTEWQDISTAPRDTDVLLCDKDGWVAIGSTAIYGNEWSNRDGDKITPTHWTPLPEPPDHKEEGR